MAQKYGHLANDTEAQTKPCVVCDDPKPAYSWTDLNGEGYCVRCGTPYQLMNGKLRDGESYPRCNIKKSWVETCRRFYQETGKSNGGGTFLGWDEYPDQLEGAKAFAEWCKAHEDELPKKPE